MPPDPRGSRASIESRRFRVEIEVDLCAVEANAAAMCERLRPGAELCAVVKADGYGHGAVACAGAALKGGASRLAVAAAGEAADVRQASSACPILIFGGLTVGELDVALGANAEIAIWDERFIPTVLARARAASVRPRMHVKVDTGMRRFGVGDASDAVRLARAVAAESDLELAGFWTHFATAEEGDRSFYRAQLENFVRVAKIVKQEFPAIALHAANSAAALSDPESHFDMVRSGVALYGLDPFQEGAADHGLTPALWLKSYIAQIRSARQGDSVGYGRTWLAPADTSLGVVPVGYADGIPRRLSNRGEALVGARRAPIVGTVSMDNLVVDLGRASGVGVGDEVVLIGRQGSEAITAEEVAARLGTINYEVVCGFGSRQRRKTTYFSTCAC